MGRGAYGTVWKAIDKLDRSRVAVKKINNAFVNTIDAIRTLREMTVMHELGAHPNIMQLHNVRIGKNHRDVYLVFELVEADLHSLIRANICSSEQRKFIMFQVAWAILYMHEADTVHRDVKPSNILVN